MKQFIHFTLLSGFLLFSCSCNKLHLPENGGKGPGHTNANMLLIWNDAATQMVTMAGTGPDGPLPPMPESRIYAMVNVAMHDALNGILPVYHTYALKVSPDNGADPDAAVAAAAHEMLATLFPPLAGYADSVYTSAIATTTSGPAQTKGIAIGKAAAAAMLAKRANDGVASAQVPYVQGMLPGLYRFTPPFDGPPFNGFAAVPGWGNITPFGLKTSAQFRPGPPYAINSPEYTKDYNEIKSLGAVTGSGRTAEQTQIGIFWLDNVPLSWNRITRSIIRQKNLDAWTAARLLGTLHMAIADANISCLEAKYYYKYWRPITAVRLADTDGNNGTSGNPTWTPLAAPTPPVPDYPSNHATNGGAAAEVLKQFFNNDNTHFSAISVALPGVTRDFTSFSQAARENSLSRIYAGYHFRNAVLTGESAGRQLGAYVFNHALLAN